MPDPTPLALAPFSAIALGGSDNALVNSASEMGSVRKHSRMRRKGCQEPFS